MNDRIIIDIALHIHIGSSIYEINVVYFQIIWEKMQKLTVLLWQYTESTDAQAKKTQVFYDT